MHGQPQFFYNEGEAQGSIKQKFMTRIKSGECDECPTCGRYTKVYHRHIHATVAMQLICMYRIVTAPGRELSEYIDANEIQMKFRRVVGDLSKAKYWGLLEAKDHTPGEKRSSGFWRLTQMGVEFVKGELKIQKYAHVYDDKVLATSGPMVSIQECLKAKYDYTQLMEM